jgi:hypothetical protein
MRLEFELWTKVSGQRGRAVMLLDNQRRYANFAQSIAHLGMESPHPTNLDVGEVILNGNNVIGHYDHGIRRSPVGAHPGAMLYLLAAA